MKTSVTLKNGTVLEVGKTYAFDEIDEFERGDCFTILFIGNDKMVYKYNSDAIENVRSIDKRLLILPYTAPQEEVKWKTFLIERGERAHNGRVIVQFPSMENAKSHYPHAKKITEVEIDIREK